MPLTTDSLVSTKLRSSQASPGLVARPRLTVRLEREVGRKLKLISAPAGFGKTTLLVEWLRKRADGEGSVAWLSPDEGDNDPVQFLSYLVAALMKTVGEGYGDGVLTALRSPESPRMEALLGALINERPDLSGEVRFRRRAAEYHRRRQATGGRAKCARRGFARSREILYIL